MEKLSAATSRSVGRFGLIGLVATLLDFSLYNLALSNFDMGTIMASLISATVALIFSVLANQIFIFNSPSRRLFKQALLFLLVTASGVYLVQSGVIYLLINIWSWPLEVGYGLTGLFGAEDVLARELFFNNAAKGLAVMLAVIWNYVLWQKLVLSGQRSGLADRLGDWLAEHRRGVGLGLVLLLAAALRLYDLTVLPPGLAPDTATNGLLALKVLEGDLQPLYVHGGSGLLTYLQAVSIAIFGNTMLALRLVTALIGIAAVAFTYLAGKEWFSVRTGVIATLLMATAPWAVQLSRLGLEAVWPMLLVPLLMWLVARALKSNHTGWFVASGITFGLGFYAYSGWWVTLLVIVAVLALVRWRYRRELKRIRQPLTIIALSAAVVLLPLVLSVAANPEDFSAAAVRVLDSPDGGWQAAPGALLETAGMFHFRGDQDFRHNLGATPQLNAFAGIVFALGVLLALRRWRDIRCLTLLVMLAVLLIPQLGIVKTVPDAARAAGIVPIVFILSALGLIELLRRWKTVFPCNPAAYNLAVFLITLSVFLAVTYDFQRYFVAWANAPQTFSAHHEELYLSAQYLLDNPNAGRTYLVLEQKFESPIAYLTTGKTDYRRIGPRRAADLPIDAQTQLLIPRVATAAVVDLPASLKCRDHTSPRRPATVVFTLCRP